ncbi:hypothetical protein GCM10022406_37830 [Hymenobacter algoricola]|uniref:Bulb-type lectin domain-containing protein n=2 Tax=Hymenobacter algoricola TaxID=486267 RepID=A0ABP7NSM1_9BACT
MQPAERARPSVKPVPAVAALPPPKPPRIYRLAHLDTLVKLPGRVISLYPAPRRTYEQLPPPAWLAPPAAESEAEELDLTVEEKRQLQQAGPKVKRVGKTLWLRPTAAPAVQLVNKLADDDTYTTYEYLTALPDIHYWLVSVHLYEGGYYLLINQRTGKRTRVWSPPSVAPDGRHFVCGNSDVLARFEPSGLQVWSTDGPAPRLLWERQTEWGVSGPRWLDNKTILFEQDFFDNGDVDTRVVRMTVVP